MKGEWKRRTLALAAGAMLLGGSLTVCAAEEIYPAGYHVYEVQEDQASDTWYGISRGDYLQSGSAKLKKEDSTHAICSGTTLAHRDCDKVLVRVYLDKSDTGTGGWGTLNYWTGTTYNNSSAYVSSGSYRVSSGKYYRATGAHTVTENGVVEATNTSSSAMKFD